IGFAELRHVRQRVRYRHELRCGRVRRDVHWHPGQLWWHMQERAERFAELRPMWERMRDWSVVYCRRVRRQLWRWPDELRWHLPRYEHGHIQLRCVRAR